MKNHRSTKQTHYYNKGNNAGTTNPLFPVMNNIDDYKTEHTFKDVIFVTIFMFLFFGGFLIWIV